MLPATRRLNLRLIDRSVRGTRAEGRLLGLKDVPLGLESATRFAVVVSKKTARRAVDRNRIKRQINSAIALVLPQVKSGHGVIVYAKAPVIDSSFAQIKQELDSLLKQVNVI